MKTEPKRLTNKRQRYTKNTKRFDDGGSVSFGQAYKAHRAAGDDTFEWNGKTYTTQSKEEAAAGKATPGPSRRNQGMPEVTVSASRNSPRAMDAMGDRDLPDSSIYHPALMRALRSSDQDRAQYVRNAEVAQAAQDQATTQGLARAMMGPIAGSGTALVGAGLGAGAAGVAGLEGMDATAAAKEAARIANNRRMWTEYPGIIRGAKTDADLSGIIGGYKKGGSIKKKFDGGGNVTPADIMQKMTTKQPTPPAPQKKVSKPYKSASAEDDNVPSWVQDEAKRMQGNKKGGTIKKYASGGSVRGSGCETKGRTRGTNR